MSAFLSEWCVNRNGKSSASLIDKVTVSVSGFQWYILKFERNCILVGLILKEEHIFFLLVLLFYTQVIVVNLLMNPLYVYIVNISMV